MYAIETENLVKEFDGLRAVDGIDLEIERGELFGLLGPNGAGKTTLIKMLSTLLRPTSGSARVWGYDVSKEQNEVRMCIGIVFQDPSVDNKLTGRENLDFHARMYGMKKELREERIREVLSLVELEDRADVLLENYSGGMQRRLEIARGLMHRPKVLFLDEPTLGLDAQTRRRIWEYIKKMNEEGVTIVLTTHYMEEADYLCDRVAIMDRGRIVALDTPENLKNSIGSDIISIEISDRDVSEILSEWEWVKGMNRTNGRIEISVENGSERIPEVILSLSRAGITIKSIELHEPTLEDVFLYLTGRKIRDEKGGAKEIARRIFAGRRR
ncbi:MAG: ATP-binding cassette domain-containing protein [Candidatus Syntropharchaeia archaeon]